MSANVMGADHPKIEDGAKKWEEIGISNDFLFGKIMRDPRLCKKLLQRILPELAIDRVEYPEAQKSIREDADARSVRLDVYTKDDNDIIYDVEMQAADTKELPKRSRYYQSMIDLQLIEKGEPYNKLNRSFVIFICTFDLFGKGRHIYTFENRCKEDASIVLKDDAVRIFLNANGVVEDVSDDLKAFLDYVAGKPSDDAYVRELDEAVKKAKKNRKWRRDFMTLLMRDQENLEKGRKEGKLSSVKNLMKNMEWTPEQALRVLDVPEDEWEKYMQKLTR